MNVIAVLAVCFAGLALACIVARVCCRGWTRAEPENADTRIRHD